MSDGRRPINLLPVCFLCGGDRSCKLGWACLGRYMSPPELRTTTNRILGFIGSAILVAGWVSGGPR